LFLLKYLPKLEAAFSLNLFPAELENGLPLASPLFSLVVLIKLELLWLAELLFSKCCLLLRTLAVLLVVVLELVVSFLHKTFVTEPDVGDVWPAITVVVLVVVVVAAALGVVPELFGF
jgi:hypothetical protein